MFFADNGYPIFTADNISTLTIEDIVAAEGERVPEVSESQREFRAAAILLIDEDHPASREQLESVSNHVSWFSHPAEDEYDQSYNFHEATGLRGTMTMGGLSPIQTGRRAGGNGIWSLDDGYQRPHAGDLATR